MALSIVPPGDAVLLHQGPLAGHWPTWGRLAAVDLPAEDFRELDVHRHVAVMINSGTHAIMHDQR